MEGRPTKPNKKEEDKRRAEDIERLEKQLEIEGKEITRLNKEREDRILDDSEKNRLDYLTRRGKDAREQLEKLEREKSGEK